MKTEILAAKGYNISDIAKDYNLTGAKLNLILQQKGVIYTSKKSWFLCDAYKNSGIAKELTTEFKKPYCTFANTKLKWTNKGKVFIKGLLGV